MTRRSLLAAGAAAASTPVLGRSFGSQAASHTQLFADDTISYEAMRALGYASVGGADVMEVLQALDGIDPKQPDTWYTAFTALAQRVEGYAEDARHPVSARQAYLRASMYYRSAGFFLTITPDDPRQMACYDASVASFRKAVPLLQDVRQVQIPYAGKFLPGYFAKGKGTGPRPLLIMHTGFDGTAEEIYFCAVGAVERGFSCLIFDGPGQGGALRKQGLHFLADWEKPVKAVVDFAEKLPEVKLDKLAIVGYSFGGYLAPRAAAFEPRLKYCVANGGVSDMRKVVMDRMPPEMVQLLSEAPAEFDKYFIEGVKDNLGAKWALFNGIYTFGKSTPSAWVNALTDYNLLPVAKQIRAECLIIDSEEDTMMPNQARPLYDAIVAPKTWLMFTKAEGAQLHCQVGAQLRANQRIFDWLDERINPR